MLNINEKFSTIDATPADELFNTVNIGETLINLCIEYGRKLALEDYIKAVDEKNYLSVTDVKGILGMIGEEKDE